MVASSSSRLSCQDLWTLHVLLFYDPVESPLRHLSRQSIPFFFFPPSRLKFSRTVQPNPRASVHVLRIQGRPSLKQFSRVKVLFELAIDTRWARVENFLRCDSPFWRIMASISQRHQPKAPASIKKTRELWYVNLRPRRRPLGRTDRKEREEKKRRDKPVCIHKKGRRRSRRKKRTAILYFVHG